MFAKLKQHWKKEYLLLAVATICVIIYACRQQLSSSEQAQEVINWLPVVGGLAFGFNTLISLVK